MEMRCDVGEMRCLSSPRLASTMTVDEYSSRGCDGVPRLHLVLANDEITLVRDNHRCEITSVRDKCSVYIPTNTQGARSRAD